VKANPDYINIKLYVEGKLDCQAMHEIEKSALDDPFLADALEGYSFSGTNNERQLSFLQRQLKERIAVQQNNKNIFNFTWQRLSIAAAAGLMFIIAGILFWMNSFQTPKNEAQKRVDINLSPLAKKADIPPKNQIKKLSEIVTVYFANTKITGVYPEKGWTFYDEYIRKNIHFLGGNNTFGDVIVAFNIKPDGTPGNLRIVKASTEIYNAEAIRLIKEGPKWISSGAEKSPEIQVQIKFQH
jgi:hypothetical protein